MRFENAKSVFTTFYYWFTTCLLRFTTFAIKTLKFINIKLDVLFRAVSRGSPGSPRVRSQKVQKVGED